MDLHLHRLAMHHKHRPYSAAHPRIPLLVAVTVLITLQTPRFTTGLCLNLNRRRCDGAALNRAASNGAGPVICDI